MILQKKGRTCGSALFCLAVMFVLRRILYAEINKGRRFSNLLHAHASHHGRWVHASGHSAWHSSGWRFGLWKF